MNADFLTFTEWYHYALLLLWFGVLFLGLKYFYKIEQAFKLKNDFTDGNKYAVGLLLTSFIFGFMAFLILVFAPEMGESQTSSIIFYGFVILLFLWNAYICFGNYVTQSAIIRLLLISLLMLVYFYSGMLGGLFLIAIFALIVIFYTFIWLKKTLSGS